jgi:hypothetical protein
MAVFEKLSLEFETQCDRSASTKIMETLCNSYDFSYTRDRFTDTWSCCFDLRNITLALQLVMGAGVTLAPQAVIPKLSRPRTMAHELSAP